MNSHKPNPTALTSDELAVVPPGYRATYLRMTEANNQAGVSMSLDLTARDAVDIALREVVKACRAAIVQADVTRPIVIQRVAEGGHHVG